MHINKTTLSALLCAAALFTVCAQAMDSTQPTLLKNRREFDASNDHKKVRATALYVADKALEICNSVPKNYAPREIALLKAPWEQRKEALKQATKENVIISASCGLVGQLSEDLKSIRACFVDAVKKSQQEKEIVPGWHALSQQIVAMWPENADIIELCTDEHDVLTNVQRYMLMKDDYWKVARALSCEKFRWVSRLCSFESEQADCFTTICRRIEYINLAGESIACIECPQERWKKIGFILEASQEIVEAAEKLSGASDSIHKTFVQELEKDIRDDLQNLARVCAWEQDKKDRKTALLQRFAVDNIGIKDALVALYDVNVLCDDVLHSAVRQACQEFSAYQLASGTIGNLNWWTQQYDDAKDCESRCRIAKDLLELWNNVKSGSQKLLPVKTSKQHNLSRAELNFPQYMMRVACQYWYVAAPAAAGIGYLTYKLYTEYHRKGTDESHQ